MKAPQVLPAVGSGETPPATPLSHRHDLLPLEEHLKQLLLASPRAGILGARFALTGGKRIRPQLCLLAYRHSSGNQTPTAQTYKLATVIELLHLATLLHDDVIDNATCRRSNPSINITHGNKIAVLLGDFFFGCILEAAADSNSDILSLLAATIKNMVEGELTQAYNRLNLHLTETEYMDVITKKTAALMATSCEVGARKGGADESTINAFRGFGQALGCAFQIQDDILDYMGSPEKLGKSLYSDLKEGVMTLPLIYALQHSTRKTQLAHLLMEAVLTPEVVAQAATEVEAAGGIHYARRQATAHLNEARQELRKLSPSPAKMELEWLVLNLAQREV